MNSLQDDLRHLRHAARLALRGHGGAEPNPLVGCVLVAPGATSGPGSGHIRRPDIVGWGYHRTCGEAHAEVNALAMAGTRARGATAYITLEPCNHNGRTGPCTAALIDAGVARVVIARRDPHPDAGGGMAALADAGIDVQLDERCPEAIAVSEPFVHRLEHALPWVIAKWAQTLDGRVATRTGESKWISNSLSRAMVHRQRGRVDAIITGIGTVLADDPLLTARGVRVRRTARRVIIDPQLQTPLQARLVQTASEAATTVICTDAAAQMRSSQYAALGERGVNIITVPETSNELPLAPALRELVAQHNVSVAMVEAGPGLLSRLMQQKLVNEAWVFIAPLLLGDDQAVPGLRGCTVDTLTQGQALRLIDQRLRGDDVVLRYRVH